MANPRLQELFQKYLAESLTAEELKELTGYVQKEENNDELNEIILKAYQNSEYSTNKDVDLEEAYDELNITPVKRIPWLKLAIAACLILLAGLGAYFIFNNNSKPKEVVKQEIKNDIPAPATARATLKLSDGELIYLDSANNGELAKQGAVKIAKQSDGKILYESSSSPTGGVEGAYNTLTNPRGSKVIDLLLSDGSHVWLNAASSITYPVSFIGNERNVEITGEAYFEVAHNAKQPFKVRNNSTEVEVLGTHFNVNTYKDEGTDLITLLEGSIKVVRTTTGKSRIIKPYQQAIVSPVNETIGATADDADIDMIMAWKNGSFNFGQQTDLKKIMQQLSRWYDIDIEYQTNKQIRIGGSIQRDVNVSSVLDMLQKTGSVKFKIEGKKVIVL